MITKSQKTSFFKHPIVENVISLAFALFIVLMIRSSLIEAFKIPTGSMIPTILIGDHIFANKFAYGLKIPFSDLFLDHPVYLIKRDPPKKGEVIVFLNPRDENIYFIKRVIGTPRDVIEIRNKVLYINNKEMTQTPLPAEETKRIITDLNDPQYVHSALNVFIEHLDGQDHYIFTDKHVFSGDNLGPVTVPSDSVFVMGDNRDRSNDSRFWGFVPFNNIKGKALFVWMSFSFNLHDWSFSFKPKRIGSMIHHVVK